MMFLKIPIYELAEIDLFCHNQAEGSAMAKKVRIFISELLEGYQEITHRTCTEMALDFDVTLSNLYKYRTGKGNPTAKTIDKIVKAVEENCPELLKKER